VDDRAGCAVLLAVAERLKDRTGGPTVHLVWTVQEEFNLRGAVVAAQVLSPTSRSRSTSCSPPTRPTWPTGAR
jgi:putative aminopeptidase FrvX